MAVLSSRNRLIYFRVSEEELIRFRSLAQARGSRSLSDLAREAIEGMCRDEKPDLVATNQLLECFQSLRETLQQVNHRLESLSQLPPNSKAASDEAPKKS